jgi:uncharacterized membrane protein SpoIIM required for sporulation
MNVERWVRGRRPLWEQLESLLRKIDQGGLSRLDRSQLRDLGRLYRSASADLSRARALRIGGDTQIYLNNLVVKGHNQVYQRDLNRWFDLLNFFYTTFPELVREKFLYIAVAFCIFSIPMVASYCLVLKDLNFAQLEVGKGSPLVPEHLWHMIEQRKMWTDSTQDYSPTASSEIAANNIKVAIFAFAYGITFGLGTVFVLFVNGMMIGTIFGVCQSFGMFDNLLAFVAPHGVLELTAIFISGGAGLVLGKSMLFPGQYRRSDAIKLAGRPALGLFAGCIPLLLIAGTIEGFLSPRTDVLAEQKFAISLATLVCLSVYLFAPRRPMESNKVE